jgi:hypothetical protein
MLKKTLAHTAREASIEDFWPANPDRHTALVVCDYVLLFLFVNAVLRRRRVKHSLNGLASLHRRKK